MKIGQAESGTVKFNAIRIAEAIAMVLDTKGRVDFEGTKVYMVKNVIRIDLKIEGGGN